MISTAQLRACGLDDNAIAVRVRRGSLHRVHRGVYAVGHAGVTREGRFMAAVLACGPQAVLSHRSAAAHWGFMRWEQGSVEVTVPANCSVRLRGVRVHRSRLLGRRRPLRHDGIPITSPARTLLDLAAVLPAKALRRVARQAQAERRVSIRQLEKVIERSNGHRGVPALQAIVDEGPAPTRSPLEDGLLDLLDRGGIERPQVNAALRLDGRRIVPDYLWRDQRVAIEADSREWHDHSLTREEDAIKQAILEAHGWRVLRVSSEQVSHQPAQTLARVRAALKATADQRQSA
jgi:hypothetical protein